MLFITLSVFAAGFPPKQIWKPIWHLLISVYKATTLTNGVVINCRNSLQMTFKVLLWKTSRQWIQIDGGNWVTFFVVVKCLYRRGGMFWLSMLFALLLRKSHGQMMVQTNQPNWHLKQLFFWIKAQPWNKSSDFTILNKFISSTAPVPIHMEERPTSTWREQSHLETKQHVELLKTYSADDYKNSGTTIDNFKRKFRLVLGRLDHANIPIEDLNRAFSKMPAGHAQQL